MSCSDGVGECWREKLGLRTVGDTGPRSTGGGEVALMSPVTVSRMMASATLLGPGSGVSSVMMRFGVVVVVVRVRRGLLRSCWEGEDAATADLGLLFVSTGLSCSSGVGGSERVGFSGLSELLGFMINLLKEKRGESYTEAFREGRIYEVGLGGTGTPGLGRDCKAEPDGRTRDITSGHPMKRIFGCHIVFISGLICHVIQSA